jgi:hypothetical protein
MTPTTSNPNFDKEQPEGSRETVDESLRREKAPKSPQQRTPADDEVKPGAGSEPPAGT